MTKEITIESEITSLEKYTELKAYLNDLATRAKSLIAPDKEIQKELQKARTFLNDTGKFLRADYRKKADEVMEVEKQHLAIIEPEEKRLKELKDAEDLKIEIEKRKKSFDARKEKLATIGIDLIASVSEGMDDKQFDVYFNEETAKKNEQARLELEERERKVREAEEAQKREVEIKEREQKAREEEKMRAEIAIKEAEAKAERAVIEERERIEREAAEKLAKDKLDAETLEKETKYKTFLSQHGYTDETKTDFIVEKVGNKVRLAKILAIYTIE